MATIEREIDQICLEARRLALERFVQDRANQPSLICPTCASALQVVDRNRPRTVETSFGKIAYTRGYGFCPTCEEHLAPMDKKPGLHPRASASPRLQEIAALSVLRAPANQVAEDVLRLTEISMSASTLHREARRQGERALHWKPSKNGLSK